MPRWLEIIVVVVFTAALACAQTQKIGDRLYAYISRNDSSSNSVFLVGDNGILVVDTGVNESEGRKLLKEIRKVSPLPVRWIVNTHDHRDHRGGNVAVGPDAIVISSAFTRNKALSGRKAGDRATGYELNETVGPEGITLFLGPHPVRVYPAGPAHTRGDVLVYFPDQQAIATGDLFLNASCPYMDDGDLENWIAALDQVSALPVAHVVPGHFAIAGRSELRHFRDYLADLQSQVARMDREGLTLNEIQKRLDLLAYHDLRQFPKFEATFADNAAAYYRQLRRRAAGGQAP
jgi:cyclase